MIPSLLPRPEILLVCSDPQAVQKLLETDGFRVLAVHDCSSALQVLPGHTFDAVWVALNCHHQEEFLQQLRAADSSLQVVVLADDEARAEYCQHTPLFDDGRIDWVAHEIPAALLAPWLRRSAELTRLRRELARARQHMAGACSSDAVERAELADRTPEVADANPQRIVRGELAIGGAVDLATINRAHVLSVLSQHAGNKARTARALGINRRSLYRLLEKFSAPTQ